MSNKLHCSIGVPRTFGRDCMHFSPLAINDIQWWLGNSQKFIRKVYYNNRDFTLTTDASLARRGAHRLDYGCAGGRWFENEKNQALS